MVRVRRPGRLRARPLPDLDLARPALVLRRPDVARARPEGRPGHRRAPDDRRRPRRSRRPRRTSPGSSASSRARLPGASGPAARTKTCLYTVTPDRDFVIDRVPGHPGVVVGARGGARVQVRGPVRRAARRASRSTPSPPAARRRSWRSSPPERPALRGPATNSAAGGLRPRRIALRVGRHRANLAGHRVIGPQSGHGPDSRERGGGGSHAIVDRRGSRHRLAAPVRALLAATLLVAPTLAMAGGARAADDLILKVGTDQKLETLNPWHLGHGRRLRDLPGPVRAARRLRQRPPAHAGVRGLAGRRRPTR